MSVENSNENTNEKSHIQFYGNMLYHIFSIVILSGILMAFFYLLLSIITSYAKYMETMISLLAGLTRITFGVPTVTDFNYRMISGATKVGTYPMRFVVMMLNYVGTSYTLEQMVNYNINSSYFPEYFKTKFNHIAYGNMCEVEPMKSVPDCSTMNEKLSSKGSILSLVSLYRKQESFYRDYWSDYTDRLDYPCFFTDERLVELDKVIDVLLLPVFGEIEYSIYNANSKEIESKSAYIILYSLLVLFIFIIVGIGSFTKLFPYMNRESYNVREMLLALPYYLITNNEKVKNFIIKKH